MQTLKLYDKDSYINEFNATVIKIEKYEKQFRVVLNETAFFPEGGGQFSDTGVIGNANVTDVKIENGVIWHYCDTPLEIGKQYNAKINFEERFDKMQQHSGEHIVSGIIFKKFGFSNVGFHLGDDFFTMDFDGMLSENQLSEIELLSNQVITSNVKIYAEYPDKESIKTISYRSKGEIDGETRLVYIEGIDICACCAPHVKRSGEIGIIKFLHHEKNKGGIRIYAKCGLRAIKDIQSKYDNNSKISALLCAKSDETAFAVKNLLNDMNNLKYQITGLKRELAELKISYLPENQKSVCIFEDGLTAGDMRYLANKATDKCEVIAVFCENRIGFSYICAYNKDNIDEFAKLFNAKLGGKGGISGNLLQGSITADRNSVEKFFKSI